MGREIVGIALIILVIGVAWFWFGKNVSAPQNTAIDPQNATLSP